MYVPFDYPRPIRDFLGQPGAEPNGMMLPAYVLNGHAECITRGLPAEHVVSGEDHHPDGRVYLRFAVTRRYIEAVSDFRDLDPNNPTHSGLVYVCPDCQGHSGKHSRACANG